MGEKTPTKGELAEMYVPKVIYVITPEWAKRLVRIQTAIKGLN